VDFAVGPSRAGSHRVLVAGAHEREEPFMNLAGTARREAQRGKAFFPLTFESIFDVTLRHVNSGLR